MVILLFFSLLEGSLIAILTGTTVLSAVTFTGIAIFSFYDTFAVKCS